MSKLEEIEARLAAATPGPWEWVPSTVEGGSHVLGGAGEQGFPVLRTASAAYALPRDAALIAHAPSDLAVLVAVVKAVLRLRDRVSSAPFEALTRDSMERSLKAALSKLEAST